MSSYTYIRKNAEFTSYLGRLRDRNVTSIAMDIEGEFNLHVYGERFCLLQLYDGREEVIVDPFEVSANLIRELIENRNLLKITYDCSSDRTLLAKAHGFIMNSILDLRPAVEILDFEKQDLKSVLEQAVGIRNDGNKKSFQQYNWTRRPVDPGALEYALADVRHLYRLRDALFVELTNRNLLDRYILENLKRQDREPELDRKPGLLRSGRYRRLSARRQDRFRTLFDIRERYAKELDLPPNTVLSNNDLFSLACEEMAVDAIKGNRRVPEEALEDLKRELSGAME